MILLFPDQTLYDLDHDFKITESNHPKIRV